MAPIINVDYLVNLRQSHAKKLTSLFYNFYQDSSFKSNNKWEEFITYFYLTIHFEKTSIKYY